MPPATNRRTTNRKSKSPAPNASNVNLRTTKPLVKAPQPQTIESALVDSPVLWLSAGYGNEELRRCLYMSQIDPFGFLAMLLLVVGFGWFGLIGGSVSTASADQHRHRPLQHVVSAALVVGSTVICYMHMHVLPLNERHAASEEEWAVTKYLGRWAYFTRWGLATQYVYAIGSCYVEFNPTDSTFIAPVYSNAGLIAAISFLTTLHFFAVVVADSSYSDVCSRWLARGVHYHAIQVVTHVAPSIMALSDLIIVKDAVFLHYTKPSFLALLLTTSTYILIYCWAAFFNNRATHAWPYSAVPKLLTFRNICQLAVLQISGLLFAVAVAWIILPECKIEPSYYSCMWFYHYSVEIPHM